MIQVIKGRSVDTTQKLWFWNLMDDGGEILAEGLKGYVRRSACVKAAQRAKTIMAKAGIVEQLA